MEQQFNHSQLFPETGDPVALVIGGGIAGIQAALDISGASFPVMLVERSPSIGGHALQLSETFPTLDCPQCIITPKMVELTRRHNVRIWSCAEVESVQHIDGRFIARIRRRASGVIWDKCNGCGECEAVCPVVIPSQWDRGMGIQKAIHKPFPQAVPNVFTIAEDGECGSTCPLGVNVKGYVQLVARERWDEAMDLILEDLPLPGVLGRICTRPCEEGCFRGRVDEPVAVCRIKRAAAEKSNNRRIPDAKAPTGMRVAVVGAGPSGLQAAFDLVRLGHRVSMWDALSRPGGMLWAAIPRYRLPREVLNREVKALLSLGIEFHGGCRLGDDLHLETLRERSDAVLLAMGTWVPVELGIPGSQAESVIQALDLLRMWNLEEISPPGSRAVVVGGGNSAIDAARVLLRLGMRSTIVYRRGIDHMPAIGEEVAQARAEGVEIVPWAVPVEIFTQGERVTGMRCLSARPGEPDGSGRPRPVPIPGSDFVIGCDLVIAAAGLTPTCLPGTPSEMVGGAGQMLASPDTGKTALPWLFACGDMVSGPSTVIQAMASGRRTAASVHAHLTGMTSPFVLHPPGRPWSPRDEDLRRVPHRARIRPSLADPASRWRDFGEVDPGLTPEEAVQEAGRCMACGGCARCGLCEAVCDQGAIDRAMEDRVITLEVGAVVAATGYDLLPMEKLHEYPEHPDVIDTLQFERLLCPSGPTGGEVLRPSDGRVPRRVAFISCAGSRDPERHLGYCSQVCCLALAKAALLYRDAVPDGIALIFYMDRRAMGKGHEVFLQRAAEEARIRYIRGRPTCVESLGKSLLVRAYDTQENVGVDAEADMVVLACGMTPSAGTDAIWKMVGVRTDSFGYPAGVFRKGHPVATGTPGVFVAGTAEGPKDIPDSVLQASAAAASAVTWLHGMRERAKKKINAETAEIIT
ncbi:MAG: FAD-dependent oxidoreductase [Deltaproteobacteria bacterium]|nr:FAD-dependent oxidoreductase [Deltaproteobacteria bacterium]